MKVQKIGVLTFHRCINYGSYWQARCLAEGLQERGGHVTILDHYSSLVNFKEWKCAFQPVLPTPVPATDRPLYRQKMERFFRTLDTLPLSKPFPLDQPEQMETFDLVVVGSDEVWNLFHPWYSNCPLFYGEGVRAQRLVSYAASFGNYPASWGLGPEWADRLRRFDDISVRDANSQLMIQNAMGIEPEMVLDPCLQFPVRPDAREQFHLPDPYVAVYGHNFSGSFIREIKQWAFERKLPLVSIGYRNDWADEQWITADPHDFAHFMAGCEAVATNFFHGCVFALRNKKPFVCETSPYRTYKVQGLMAKIGGEKHLVTEDTPSTTYHGLLNEIPDEQIMQKIEHLRQASHAFLDRALRLKQFEVT